MNKHREPSHPALRQLRRQVTHELKAYQAYLAEAQILCPHTLALQDEAIPDSHTARVCMECGLIERGRWVKLAESFVRIDRDAELTRAGNFNLPDDEVQS